MTGIAAVALRCVETLEGAGLDCAVGEAIALGFWSPPRATLDVNLNIFVDVDEAERALAPLLALGATGDAREMAARLRRGEAALLHLDGVRLDVFLPSIPFYEEARRRVVRIPFMGRDMPVLSAETLAVFKLLFFRNKDRVDLERMVSFLGQDLDVMWVRSQLVDMMGEDDERVPEWDRIVGMGR